MLRRLALNGLACTLLVSLCACELEFGPGGPGDDTQPAAPVVRGLSFDGASAVNNRALVVTNARTLRVTSEVAASAELEAVTISASKDEGAYAVLVTCEASPCRYDWALDAVNNGVYSFIVEAEDVRGGLSRLPYSSSLVVNIR